jgi:hypothetical protein
MLAALLVLLMVLPPQASGKLDSESRDVIAFAEDVAIDQDVSGDVQVVFGSAKVRANVAGDVIVFGGNVELEPGASVKGQIVALGGVVTGAGAGKLESRARISLAAMSDPGSMVGYALKATLLLGWILAAVILVLANAREVRTASVELRVSPYHTFALGLVAFSSFVLTAIVLTYLIPFLIGLPLLAVLAVFALMTKIFGLVAVFHAIGNLIAGPRRREDIARRRLLRGDLAMVLVGAAVLGAIRLIPVVGNFVWIGASLFGVGTALATRFGRREPWFLAWAPVIERS